MIEILVTLTVIAVLLGMFSPFASSIRADVSMSSALNQVKSDLLATMSYSLAGKSLASLSSASGPSPDLMPSHYLLLFDRDQNVDYPVDYRYIETKTDRVSSSYQPSFSIYEILKPPTNPNVFLREIRLIDSSDSVTTVDSVAVLFTPPFGKVTLLDGVSFQALKGSTTSSFDSAVVFKSTNPYERVELDYQFKNDPRTLTTLSFSRDKTFQVF